MSRPIVAQLYDLVKIQGRPLAAAIEAIIPGADLAYWARRLDSYTPGKPAGRKRSRRRGPARSRRTLNHAAQVVGLAMARQVGRVNSQRKEVAAVDDKRKKGYDDETERIRQELERRNQEIREAQRKQGK